MLPDLLLQHTKTIVDISGPTKRFRSKEGLRDRYDILFHDSYRAEFCPLVGITQDIPKPGQEFTFKIVHRGAKGDEIARMVEFRSNAAPGPVPDYTSMQRVVVNMNGHPAITALNAALKWAEIEAGKKSSSGLLTDGMVPSDILDTADIYLEWLLMKANNC